MILHENRLPADDSHEISCLICYFCKNGKIFNCRLLQTIGGALRVNIQLMEEEQEYEEGSIGMTYEKYLQLRTWCHRGHK